MYDVIIIGGGPAGASAAIYLQRFKLKTLIIMKDMGSLGKTGHIDNYYGFENTVSGVDLVQNGLKQAKRLGTKVLEEETLGIEYFDDFTVKTTKGEHKGKIVLLATGSAKPNLKIKGFNNFIGKGISYCAICDGFIYRNKKIGVIGNKEFMLEELEVLKNFSKDITVFTNGMDLEVEVEEKVVTDKLIAVEGENVVNKVITENGEFEVNALFVAMGTPSASDFAMRMGAFIENNNIVVDDKFMTNIPGLFAAGDCIGGLLQVVKAASDGAHAAISINKYIKGKS
jgi:thioredoxin reductase (NADPH)